jgi:hypothetical protein
VELPQFGSFAIAAARWKPGSDAVLTAMLGPNGSLREYRVSANTYIDKALAKGIGGLAQLVDVIREFRNVFQKRSIGSGGPSAP